VTGSKIPVISMNLGRTPQHREGGLARGRPNTRRFPQPWVPTSLGVIRGCTTGEKLEPGFGRKKGIRGCVGRRRRLGRQRHRSSARGIAGGWPAAGTQWGEGRLPQGRSGYPFVDGWAPGGSGGRRRDPVGPGALGGGQLLGDNLYGGATMLTPVTRNPPPLGWLAGGTGRALPTRARLRPSGLD